MKRDTLFPPISMLVLAVAALAASGCTTIKVIPLKDAFPVSASAYQSGPAVVLLPIEESFEKEEGSARFKADPTFLGKSLDRYLGLGMVLPVVLSFEESHLDMPRAEGVRRAVLARLQDRGIPADYQNEGGVEKLQNFPPAQLGVSLRLRRLGVERKRSFLLPSPLTWVIMRDTIISQVALDCQVWQPGQPAPVGKATVKVSKDDLGLPATTAAAVDECFKISGLLETRARLSSESHARLLGACPSNSFRPAPGNLKTVRART